MRSSRQRKRSSVDPTAPWPTPSSVPPDLRTCQITSGGEDYLVIAFRVDSDVALPDGHETPMLTEAERQVAAGAAAGLSNLEIARERETSLRTVANQLASVYRKLGIKSRAELAAYWHAIPGVPPPGR